MTNRSHTPGQTPPHKPQNPQKPVLTPADQRRSTPPGAIRRPPQKPAQPPHKSARTPGTARPRISAAIPAISAAPPPPGSNRRSGPRSGLSADSAVSAAADEQVRRLPAAPVRREDPHVTTDEKLTLSQVIADLGVPESTFYRWRQLGKGPRCIKLPNGAVRVRRSEYERWLSELEESA